MIVNYICHLINTFVAPACSLSRICCENRTESVAQLVKNPFTPLRSSPPVCIVIHVGPGKQVSHNHIFTRFPLNVNVILVNFQEHSLEPFGRFM